MHSYSIVKDILPPDAVSYLIDIVKGLNFRIANDSDEYFDNLFKKDLPFQGMSRITNEPPIGEREVRLNDFGFIIAQIACKQADLKILRIHRLMWNFYKRGELGNFHIDETRDNFHTILYSLNTNDGYLELENEKIFDVADEAKIFPSKILHRGVGPTKSKFRLNVNIVVETAPVSQGCT